MGIFTKTGYNKKYLWTHPWELIFHYGRDLKCAWQRAVKGYCYRDLWSMHDWFSELMPRMLNEFKNKNDAYPAYFNTPEEWDNEIDKMIFCFKEVNDETCSLQNEYIYNCDMNFTMDEKTGMGTLQIIYPTEEDSIKSELSYQKELEIAKYKEEKLREGLELLSKHFYSLWY